MRRKWSRIMVKATIGRADPLTKRLCMHAEAERPMDGEMLSVFNFVNVSYKALFLIFAFLEGIPYSMDWFTQGRQDLRGGLHRSPRLVLAPAPLRRT